MLPNIREVMYRDVMPKGTFFLAGDIGGTNSNFGILDTHNEHPQLILSLHTKSQEVEDYATLIAELCGYMKDTYHIAIERACIGAAGVVAENRTSVTPTNLTKLIDAQEIEHEAHLEKVVLINDFEAVALGLDAINPRDIIMVHKGKTRPYAHKACIGAGTGMGKSALLWNRRFQRYLPISSEGGHADAAGQTAQEIALFDMIKSERTLSSDAAVSWEEVLSGSGLQRIYRFLENTGSYTPALCSMEIQQSGFQPDAISRYAKTGESLCVDTFLLYARLYARCAKNFVLDMLALNGIYIAGGIAAKNVELFFNPLFLNEFLQSERQAKLLSDVSLFVIADYNVSLFGAAVFMALYDQGIV
jgi:glucokinase